MNRASRELPAISRLAERADELLEAARAFQAAARKPHSSATAPDALLLLEEALQALSASWYAVAADAAPGIGERRDQRPGAGATSLPDHGLSHEQEALVMATLHDVAGAFGRCAGVCRDGRSVVTPLLDEPAGAAPRITDDPRLTAPEIEAA